MVRRHTRGSGSRDTLEHWARQPGEAIDPVTYALVDEDESVRTRAQELYEQHFSRETAQGEAQRGQTP